MIRKSRREICEVFLSDRAINDFLEIEQYSVAKWSKSVASKYILKFENAFKLLEQNPELLLPDPLLSDGLLFFRIEKHLIVCIRTQAKILVLTIVHASRDLPNLLHELTPTLKDEVVAILKRLQE